MHASVEHGPVLCSDSNILCLSWKGRVPKSEKEKPVCRRRYYEEGWLATGNGRGVVGVTFTLSHCRRDRNTPQRTNFNLRGHNSEVVLVRWNEPFQKLATCDADGGIFVWIQYEGRWSVELVNDRGAQVSDFTWSHDGTQALISYRDGFVLVGSVSGQRHWSSEINLESQITCGIWTPDDQQVLFGTADGQVIVMDCHGRMLAHVLLHESDGILSMSWNYPSFLVEDSSESDTDSDDYSPPQDGPAAYPIPVENIKPLLTVGFTSGDISLMNNYDDLSPTIIRSGLKDVVVQWCTQGDLLAVAGIEKQNMLPDLGNGASLKSALIKFYNVRGEHIYTLETPVQRPITSICWGHRDSRLFLASGPALYVVRVEHRVASLQLLCQQSIASSLRDDKDISKLNLPPRLCSYLTTAFVPTIKPPIPDPNNMRDFVSYPTSGNERLHCTMKRTEDDPEVGGPCYTLYLEYLGGLVPVLKGRRISKLRPEFVIMDPKTDTKTDEIYGNGLISSVIDSCNCSDSSDIELSDDWAAKKSPKITRASKSPKLPRINIEARKSPKLSRAAQEVTRSPRLPIRKPSIGSPSLTRREFPLDDISQHNYLAQVTSNIWGTKFKIVGLAAFLPANLGAVIYKTSLLHLQPRQMTIYLPEVRKISMDYINLPVFNTNVFSEDEDDLPVSGTSGAPENNPPCTVNIPIAPIHSSAQAMSPTQSIGLVQSLLANQNVQLDVLSNQMVVAAPTDHPGENAIQYPVPNRYSNPGQVIFGGVEMGRLQPPQPTQQVPHLSQVPHQVPYSSQISHNPQLPHSSQLPHSTQLPHPSQLPHSAQLPHPSQLPHSAQLPHPSQLTHSAQLPHPSQLPHSAQLPHPSQLPHSAQLPHPSQLPHSAQLPHPSQLPHSAQLPHPSQLPHLTQLPHSSQLPHSTQLPHSSQLLHSTQLPHSSQLSHSTQMSSSSQLPHSTQIPLSSQLSHSAQMPHSSHISHAAQLPHSSHMPHSSQLPHSAQMLHSSQLSHPAQMPHSSQLSHSTQTPHSSQLSHSTQTPHSSQLSHSAQTPHSSQLSHSAQTTHSSQLSHSAQTPHSSQLSHSTLMPHSAQLSHSSQMPHSAQLPPSIQVPHSSYVPHSSQLSHSTQISPSVQLPHPSHVPHTSHVPHSSHLLHSTQMPHSSQLPNSTQMSHSAQMSYSSQLSHSTQTPHTPQGAAQISVTDHNDRDHEHTQKVKPLRSIPQFAESESVVFTTVQEMQMNKLNPPPPYPGTIPAPPTSAAPPPPITQPPADLCLKKGDFPLFTSGHYQTPLGYERITTFDSSGNVEEVCRPRTRILCTQNTYTLPGPGSSATLRVSATEKKIKQPCTSATLNRLTVPRYSIPPGDPPPYPEIAAQLAQGRNMAQRIDSSLIHATLRRNSREAALKMAQMVDNQRSTLQHPHKSKSNAVSGQYQQRTPSTLYTCSQCSNGTGVISNSISNHSGNISTNTLGTGNNRADVSTGRGSQQSTVIVHSTSATPLASQSSYNLLSPSETCRDRTDYINSAFTEDEAVSQHCQVEKPVRHMNLTESGLTIKRPPPYHWDPMVSEDVWVPQERTGHNTLPLPQRPPPLIIQQSHHLDSSRVPFISPKSPTSPSATFQANYGFGVSYNGNYSIPPPLQQVQNPCSPKETSSPAQYVQQEPTTYPPNLPCCPLPPMYPGSSNCNGLQLPAIALHTWNVYSACPPVQNSQSTLPPKPHLAPEKTVLSPPQPELQSNVGTEVMVETADNFQEVLSLTESPAPQRTDKFAKKNRKRLDSRAEEGNVQAITEGKGKKEARTLGDFNSLIASPRLGREKKKVKSQKDQLKTKKLNKTNEFQDSSESEPELFISGDELMNQSQSNKKGWKTKRNLRTASDLDEFKCRKANEKDDGRLGSQGFVYVMANKQPLWNEATQVYQLDFGGRVTQESAKNFQIELEGRQVMQFGRIDGNAYILDFQYPFSAVQAFAVALANVTQRLK
ncbi:tubby-related protein 4 isoform X2 [Spea bombifrons]|uniref:tubby-related protein 4 isoform X2 n=1 Tax=Spea bombifrons TaxID=233779 RepID=UPI00234A0FF0|nr:tubby-related protein 4 isoform X2 [Spea bombifrons]